VPCMKVGVWVRHLHMMCRFHEGEEHGSVVKVKVTAIGEERKAPTTMEKNGYDFITDT
jgi:hypothetical protein